MGLTTGAFEPVTLFDGTAGFFNGAESLAAGLFSGGGVFKLTGRAPAFISARRLTGPGAVLGAGLRTAWVVERAARIAGFTAAGALGARVEELFSRFMLAIWIIALSTSCAGAGGKAATFNAATLCPSNSVLQRKSDPGISKLQTAVVRL